MTIKTYKPVESLSGFSPIGRVGGYDISILTEEAGISNLEVMSSPVVLSVKFPDHGLITVTFAATQIIVSSERLMSDVRLNIAEVAELEIRGYTTQTLNIPIESGLYVEA